MKQDRKQKIAIAPVITGTAEDYSLLREYFRETSAKGLSAPDGRLRHYSPKTIEKWHLAYKHSDLLALSGTSISLPKGWNLLLRKANAKFDLRLKYAFFSGKG